MPKTIFSKLLAVFISILLIAFLITAGMLYIFLNNLISSEKVELLNRSGERINSFLKLYVDNNGSNVMSLVIDNVLKTYAENTEAVIWITDTEGKVVFMDENSIQKNVLSKLKKSNGQYQLPDERQYKWIKEKSTQNSIQGDFYGLFENTGVSWITVMLPFKYKAGLSEEKILGGVYLSTPIPELKKLQQDVFELFIIAVIISIVISIGLIYFFSLKISTPLKNLKEATKEIESGNYINQIDVKSDDEIGQLTESFNNMSYAIRNLEEMRREFIANVSHELRTPMTSIKGFIEGILDGTIPKEKSDVYLTIVNDEITRLYKLVNDILVLAKVETEELILNKSNFDINELIRRCIIKLEAQFNMKGLEVEAVFDYEKIMVNADFEAIERVILNLLHNAIKFSNIKGVISIFVKEKRDKVYVAIEDNGIGIDEKEIEFIWDRFFKSDRSRSKDKEGSGLGLSIVKKIINKHEQEIWVESQLNKGSKFEFTLDLFEYY